MKELISRVNNIAQGECNPTHLEYDYHGTLYRATELLNPNGILVYKGEVITILAKIDALLLKDKIVLNSKYKVFDEDGDYVNGHYGDESGYFVSYRECTNDQKDDIESKLRSELLAYQEALVYKMGISITKAPIVMEVALSSPAKDEQATSKITRLLDDFKVNMSGPDFDSLVMALNKYFETGKFPLLSQSIVVTGKPNKKAFGWALNLVFSRCKGGKLPIEYLLFAKQNITLFKDVEFYETNYRNSNLYKYFTTKS